MTVAGFVDSIVSPHETRQRELADEQAKKIKEEEENASQGDVVAKLGYIFNRASSAISERFATSRQRAEDSIAKTIDITSGSAPEHDYKQLVIYTVGGLLVLKVIKELF